MITFLRSTGHKSKLYPSHTELRDRSLISDLGGGGVANPSLWAGYKHQLVVSSSSDWDPRDFTDYFLLSSIEKLVVKWETESLRIYNYEF